MDAPPPPPPAQLDVYVEFVPTECRDSNSALRLGLSAPGAIREEGALCVVLETLLESADPGSISVFSLRQCEGEDGCPSSLPASVPFVTYLLVWVG